jgi:hypothetical protein
MAQLDGEVLYVTTRERDDLLGARRMLVEYETCETCETCETFRGAFDAPAHAQATLLRMVPRAAAQHALARPLYVRVDPARALRPLADE